MHTHYMARVTRFDVHIDSLGVDRGGRAPDCQGPTTGCFNRVLARLIQPCPEKCSLARDSAQFARDGRDASNLP